MAMQTFPYREELLNNWEPPTCTEINRRMLGEVCAEIAKEERGQEEIRADAARLCNTVKTLRTQQS